MIISKSIKKSVQKLIILRLLYTQTGCANWGIDLFGRIRRSVEAATADYQARLTAAESNIESQKDLLRQLPDILPPPSGTMEERCHLRYLKYC